MSTHDFTISCLVPLKFRKLQRQLFIISNKKLKKSQVSFLKATWVWRSYKYNTMINGNTE